MKEIYKSILIGFLLTIVLVGLHLFYFQLHDDITDWKTFIKYSFLYNALYAIPFYVVNASIHQFACKKEKRSKLSFPAFWGRYLIIIVLINTLLALLITLVSNIIDNNGFNGISRIDIWFFLSTLFISLCIGGFFYSYFYLKKKFDKKSAKQEVKIQQVTQSHEALKSQIGPHFLFNSLNVLSGLVYENPDKAQDFIADLAQVYRYVLDQKDKEWVTLEEEIEFAENYIELLKTRFEDGMIVQIQEDLKNSQTIIAPLTLQLLLENVIKHNVITKDTPLVINIFLEGNELVVQNNLNSKKIHSTREGTGLKQIKERYALLDKKVEILKEEKKFKVRIPLLTVGDLN